MGFKKFDTKEMMEMLPVIFSDLKHHQDIERRFASNENIRKDMFYHVIREMYSRERFLFNVELNDGSTRTGLFIKGFVRDVWAYLEEAYDLIHQTDFMTILCKQEKRRNKSTREDL